MKWNKEFKRRMMMLQRKKCAEYFLDSVRVIAASQGYLLRLLRGLLDLFSD